MEQSGIKENVKILIIDDEEELLDLLSRELSLAGYKVLTASNSKEAVEALKKEPVQVVVSDMQMPETDGIQLLEIIKKMNPTIEVIMITGHGTIEASVSAMKKGAYDLIQKPIDSKKLMPLIDKALEKSELKTLYEMSKIVFSKTKSDELLPSIVNLSQKLLKADDISVMLIQKDGKFHLAASYGLDDENKKDVRLTFGERIAGKVAEWKESTIIVGSLENDDRFHGVQSRNDIKSSLICPLKSAAGVIGILCATRTKNEIPFDQTDKQYIEVFASQISQTLYIAQFINSLEEKIEQTQKTSMLGQIASAVVHDLKNVVGTTLISMEVLMEEQFGLNDEAKECLNIAVRNASVAAETLSQLMEMVKGNSAELVPGKVAFVLQEALDLMKTKSRKQNVRLEIDIEKNAPDALIDEVNLRGAFLNLLLNALDAMQEGGKLTVKCSSSKDLKQVFVTIEDTGPGVEEYLIEKMGTPFFTTKKSGTGIGFYMAKRIFESHHAELKAENLPDRKGFKLMISFPSVK